jgi:hypothetical protein
MKFCTMDETSPEALRYVSHDPSHIQKQWEKEAEKKQMVVVARRADKNRVILFNGTNESPVPKCHLTHCAPKRLTVTVVSQKVKCHWHRYPQQQPRSLR